MPKVTLRRPPAPQSQGLVAKSALITPFPPLQDFCHVDAGLHPVGPRRPAPAGGL